VKRFLIAIGLTGVVLIAGCFPERVVWAPNGEYAAVVGGDGLYLCDGEGNLAGPAEPARNLPDEMVVVAWFPDSQRCLAIVETEVRTWAELEQSLSEEQKNELVSLANAFREDILASYQGDLGRMKTVRGMENDKILSLKIYLRDHPDEKLVEKLGDRWKEFEDASRSGSAIQVFRVENGRLKAGPVIVESLGTIVTLRISPIGKSAAYVQISPASKEVTSLYVVPTDGSAGARMVARMASGYPDWTRDGQALVYLAPLAAHWEDNWAMIGSLVRRRVCDRDGALLPDFSGEQELAGLIPCAYSKVRCLEDGRILFSSAEFHLPATSQDMPEQTTIFSVDPARRATVARAVPSEAAASLPSIADIFEVSPDGTRVAIASERGEVSVLTLATGHVVHVQPDQEPGPHDYGLYIRTMPNWRSKDELCFAAPPHTSHGSPDSAEIVLWSEKDGYRCISKNWPESVRKGFLE